MTERFHRALSEIVSSHERELEWLDLLSQLEYVGCRKILKAVPFCQISLAVLQHISEEASHAYLLKSLVGSGDSWENRPLAAIGWRYFQSLDQAISRLAEMRGLEYPAVSWAVEQRVLSVYPRYLELTTNHEVRRVLSRILAQERRHAAEFGAVSYPQHLRERIRAIEASLWAVFVTELEAYLAGLPLPEWASLVAPGEYCELGATD